MQGNCRTFVRQTSGSAELQVDEIAIPHDEKGDEGSQDQYTQ